MAFNPILDTEIQPGAPVDTALFDKIQDDFADHEIRILNQEINASPDLAIRASQIPIDDAGSLFAAEDVETALQELMTKANTNKADTNTAILNHSAQIGALSSTLNTVGTSVDSQDVRISSLESTVPELSNQIGDHETRLTAVENAEVGQAAQIISLGNRTTSLEGQIVNKANTADLTIHTLDHSNPHLVTKVQVGLSNVDNTSDASKPVSVATQSALDLKANQTTLVTHITDISNPHAVTKTQIGLSNVDNTSDVSKPVSTAQQAALDLKADITSVYTKTQTDTAYEPKNVNIQSHILNTTNPHNVTKAQVGLGNVDNTSDMDKPVSTAQATAIAQAKADIVASSPATLDTLNELASALGNDPNFATTVSTSLGNRLRVDTAAQGLTSAQKINTKTNIDLQNVDNTSDLSKPISTATQTALNLKENGLGNPSVSGQVLSSDTSGNRSWITPAAGGGATNDSQLTVTANGLNKTLKTALEDGSLAPSVMDTAIAVPKITTEDVQLINGSTTSTAIITNYSTITNTTNGILSYNTGRVTVLKDCTVSAFFKARNNAAAAGTVEILKNGTMITSDDAPTSTGWTCETNWNGKLLVGEYLEFRVQGNMNNVNAGVTATAIESENRTVKLTQAGLTQTLDSMLRVSGLSRASTNTAVYNYANTISQKGNNILATSSPTLGSTFTILDDTYCSISVSLPSNGATTAQHVGITLNQSSLFTTGPYTTAYTPDVLLATSRDTDAAGGAGKMPSISWSGPLPAGSVLRVIGDPADVTVLSNATITIACAGSLKQVNVNPAQKATIPTHELRFEGASTRGSIATSIVKFDSIAKLRGDGFTVLSDSSNGTAVTVTKAGRLTVSSTLSLSSINTVMVISKNQSTLTALPSQSSEILTTTQAYTATATTSVSTTVDVIAGDIIRVSTNQAPTATINAVLSLTLQEQQVAVSVSNTLPQFSDSDSAIRLSGSNGYGSTATKIRRFSSVNQNMGTDIVYTDDVAQGASFKIVTPGIYSIAWSDSFSLSNTYMAFSVNSINLTTNASSLPAADVLEINIHPVSNGLADVTWSGWLNTGDLIRPHAEGAASATGIFGHFSICKVGKPTVTGIDVTPFIKTGLIDTQSMRNTAYQQTLVSGTGINIRYNLTNTISKGSGIFSVIDDGTNTRFTALKKCSVVLTTVLITGQSVSNQIQFKVNGAIQTMVSQNNTISDYCQGTFAVELEAGEYITVSTSNALRAGVGDFQITAMASADTVLTVPQTFSTDNANLTYSSTYNLATLKDAPVGTYITFTYGANTLISTQTTTAPTQTLSDMNLNGIFLFGKNYASAPTTGTPGRFAIQIGKGLFVNRPTIYSSTGKASGSEVDFTPNAFGVTDYGMQWTYNPTTGIFDCNVAAISGFANKWIGVESSANARQSGYLVINASKTPALAGMGLDRVAMKAVITSQPSLSGSSNILTYDALPVFDTHAGMNTATGVYTVQKSAIYNINAAVWVNTKAYTAGNALYLSVYKNGVFQEYNVQRMAGFTNNASTTLNSTLKLAKGDTIHILYNNEAGVANLGPNSCFFAITEL